MNLKVTIRPVYFGGGRYWLTLKAAAKKEAHAVIIARHGCHCEAGDKDTPPIFCGWHPGYGVKEYEKRLRRLTRIYIKHYKELEKIAKESELKHD